MHGCLYGIYFDWVWHCHFCRSIPIFLVVCLNAYAVAAFRDIIGKICVMCFLVININAVLIKFVIAVIIVSYEFAYHSLLKFIIYE